MLQLWLLIIYLYLVKLTMKLNLDVTKTQWILMPFLQAWSLHFISRIPFFFPRSLRDKIINLSIADCGFPQADWEGSSVYIFRPECGISAISIFILPFWLFHLGGYKNFAAWNSHRPGITVGCMQNCHLAVVQCNCLILFPLLSSFSFLSFHYFHFFSFMLTFFISNSLSCVVLSPSFESKLPGPCLIALSV